MMKFFLSLLLLSMGPVVFGQQKTITEAEKASLDSMLQNDEFFNMMKEAIKPKSYFLVSAGLGNSYFSVKNKRLEAAQLDNKIVFTPEFAYYHKSGFALAADAFLTSFNGKSNFYQFSLTPSYSLRSDKKVSLSLSYTRFFRRSGYESAASPIQNDIFGSLYLKKPWLQPGLSLGFSEGKNTVYKHIDTFFLGQQRKFTDTAKISIRTFSVSAFVQHEFEFYDVLKKDDGLSVVPKILLNAGSNKYTEKHYNPYSAFFKRVAQRLASLGRLQDNSSFEVQSAACSLDVNYLIGKFGFEPQVYLDYYFPDTTDKKFTYVCSFAISYSF